MARNSVVIQKDDRHDIHDLYVEIQSSKAKLVGPDGKSHRLPESLLKFLVQLRADLNEGRSVSIIRKDATLTTAEAASMLGVSRQFIVNLLERNAIAHHKVGTHRRIYMTDLLTYKAHRDSGRRNALDELAKAETDEGIYD